MHDVIIIGGGFAGLAAATQLGRARRKVLVLDTGLPRNRFAKAAHGFLSREDMPPADLLAEARRQLDTYKTVEIRPARAIAGRKGDEGFEIELEGGALETTRRIILAHGVTDDLGILPGLAECWGKTAIHCPYCHGYEVADRRLGLILRVGDPLHMAKLLADWSKDLTFFTNGTPLEATLRAELVARGVKLVTDRVLGLDHDNGQLRAVSTAAGPVGLDAVFVHPPIRFSSNIGVELGCETKDGYVGPVFVVDQLQQTSVPGVYAAGDVARMAHSISFAVGDGSGAGAFCHQSLLA